MISALLILAAATVVHGRQAEVATSFTMRDGTHATLAVEIDLRPGVHVYAPGAEGYIPVAWALDESPAYKAHDVQMPAARKMYLQAIDETVPVYEGKFRLTREVDLRTSGSAEIGGTLRYQACDDRMCYRPEKLALHWSLTSPPSRP